jgi:hypothetical protein
VTDGGVPALAPTGSDIFEIMSAVTVASDIANSRVHIIYRAQPRPGLGIQNIEVHAVSRFTDLNNNYQALRAYGDGNSSLSLHEFIAGGDANKGALGGNLALNNADTASIQHVLTDNILDVSRAQWWFDSSGVPAEWMGNPARFNGNSGWGAGGGGENIVPTGKAGLVSRYGPIVYDIIVEELLPLSISPFLNGIPDLAWTDSLGRPFWAGWDSQFNDEHGLGLVEIVTIIGPFGAPVKAYRVARDAPQPGSNAGPMVTWVLDKRNALGNGVAMLRPIPGVGAFKTPMGTSIWTKGIGLANTNPNPAAALTARWVNYYANQDGSKSNVTEAGDGSYHWALGTANGQGTWDWTQTIHAFDMRSAGEMTRDNVTIGLHDETAYGVMYVYDPQMDVIP